MLKEKYGLKINAEEMALLDNKDYLVLDGRDEASFNYGHIDDALYLNGCLKSLDKNRSYILYAKDNSKAEEIVSKFLEEGYDIVYLKDGYNSWIEYNLGKDDTDIKEKSERSIIKTYHQELLSPFLKALDKYEMLKDGDRVAVCISGGKDSMLLAKLFQELLKFSRVKFECVFLVMDPGYNRLNRLLIEDNARKLGIPVKIFETKIFNAVDKIEKSPCYLCARMRRGHLYNAARELGCNKIALGHHYDDVIETIFMSMMYGGQVETMMPKLKSKNFKGMELIRPLYLVREKDIIRWRDSNRLHFIQCACHFVEDCTSLNEDGSTSSKRMETKKLIEELKKTNPYIEQNIFKSVENVCLDSIIEYKKDDKRHNFLEDYDRQ